VPDHALEQRAHAFDGCAYRIGKKYGRIALEDGKVKGIARQACIAVADLDHDASEYLEASYVHFRNGVLTPEGRLEPHDIEYRILDEHGRDFDFDPDAHSPALERCLFGIFGDDEDGHEKIAYLQEYLGACLFGVAAKHRIHPFLLGDGENGKSTLIKAAEQLFPPKTRTNVGPQQWATNFGLMPLIHSRFNTVPEVASARLTDTARIKGVLTGDEVTTDVKNKEHITFRPVAGHVFAANTLPSTSDKSPGFFSRFRIVRLNAYFGKGEDQYGRKPTATPDPHLGAQLEHERQGIAAWAVKGYLRFVANGHTYTQPSSAEAELRRWKRSNDLVLAFVDEYLEKLPGREACALPPSQRVSKTALLSAICLYGADEGHRTIPSKETIEQRLAVHGIRTVRTSAARCMSVRLRETCRFLPGVKAP
jgi:P4 family phage/plasmid primase-like protien